MESIIIDTIRSINEFIQKSPWCDFEILEYAEKNIKIVGSIDFTYFHELEITFRDVFFLQCNSEWKTNTDQDVFVIPSLEEERNINIQFQIEHGYHLFKIVPQDTQPFYISARNIEVNYEKVLYKGNV